MKNLLSLLAVMAALCACSRPVCHINGHLTGPVDSVRLVDMNNAMLDACAVTDGAFTLKCDRNPEAGVVIIPGEGYNPVPLIPDTKEISVSWADGQPVISGSPLSEELNDLQQWAMSTYMDYEMRALKLLEVGRKEEADALVAERHAALIGHCRAIYLDHKSDLVGNQAMILMMELLDKSDFLALYAQGGKVIQEDAMIGGYYEHLTSLPTNEIITLLANGEVETKTGFFEDYVGAGKYTLVDFWASWCGPCRQVAPDVVAAFEKYGSQGLVVIGIPVNDKQDATVKAMKEFGIRYPQLLDPTQELADKYNVSSIPCIILFDPDGQIVERYLSGADIEATLARVLDPREM